MRFLLTLLAAVALLLPLASRALASDGVPDGRTLRCESSDGRTRECAVDASGGARLLRQLSRTPCVEGDTWGRTRGSIWVTQGCRGEFLAVSNGRGEYGGRLSNGRSLRCGSDSGRWTHCAVDTRRGVELARQLSRSACIRGQSWGIDGSGIWVSGGCRAEFHVGGGDAGPVAPASSRFRCESNDGRVRTCAADTRGNVRIVRQLSRSPCVSGRTWGVEHGGVWVSDGCRAEFDVGDAWADGRW